jgi:peptidoglycan-associated lipoprotein
MKCMKHIGPVVAAVIFLGAVGCAHKKAPSARSTGTVVQTSPVKNVEPSNVSLSSGDADMRNAVLRFAFNEAILAPEGRDLLQRVADTMKRDQKATVNIAGHCDERGTQEYNLMLGNRRAEVARKYLMDLGVDPSRISTISYGHEKPVAPGKDEGSYAQNRRDEVNVN